LKFDSLESPYFIAANIYDVSGFSALATLGGLLSANHSHYRSPRVEIRVGSYKFDNTNYVGSGYIFGSNYDIDHLPLDDNYNLLRRYLWLGIDRSYKSAVEAISRKRAALKNMSVGESPDHFTTVEPLHRIESVSTGTYDEEKWKARVRSLSAVFAKYPELRNSSAEYSGARDVRYLVTTEGTEVRTEEHVEFIRLRASIQASDGM